MHHIKGISQLLLAAALEKEESRRAAVSGTYPVQHPCLRQRVAESKHQHFSTELFWSEPVRANVGRFQEIQSVRMRVRITIFET